MAADFFCWVLVLILNQRLRGISDFTNIKEGTWENNFYFSVTYLFHTENRDFLSYLGQQKYHWNNTFLWQSIVDGRKGVGDEVLELPIGIMQSNAG